jgi:2-oxoglutarate dehydrogenase complex dehydrogenase (E1) component-like enzyme
MPPWSTSERGTLFPAAHVAAKQGTFEVIDSLLSEEAVLGFEYGYSTAEPKAWCCGKPSSATSPTARKL